MSLREVARRANVSAPSVYLHFKDKQELVAAVLAVKFAELEAAIRTAVEHAIAATADDSGAVLRAGCRAYLDYADREAGYRVLFGTRTALQFGVNANAPGRHTLETLVFGVQRCQEAGEAPTADPFRVACTVWTGLHGIATLPRARPDFDWPDPDALLEDLLVGVVGVPRRSW